LFECLGPWLPEHISIFDCRQPIWISGGVEVTASYSVALNKWSWSKLFQARTRADQRLATTISTGIGMLKKWKPNVTFYLHVCYVYVTPNLWNCRFHEISNTDADYTKSEILLPHSQNRQILIADFMNKVDFYLPIAWIRYNIIMI